MPLDDLAPAHVRNRELLDYWRSLRVPDGTVPARVEFEPGRVRKALPNLLILDRPDDGQWRVRLMGTNLVDRYGRDLTGENLLSVIPEPLRPEIEAMYGEVLGLPSVYLVGRELRRASGIIHELEALHLPLAGSGGDVAFAMTAMWPVSNPIDVHIDDLTDFAPLTVTRRRASL